MEKQWEEAIKLPGFLDWMPRDWVGGPGAKKRRERSFFYCILITQAPSFCEELVKDCRRQRVEALQAKVNKPQPLYIANNWLGPLLEQPFIPSKCLIFPAFDLGQVHWLYNLLVGSSITSR